MKIFVRLLCLSSLSSGFVTQNPNRSARIRLTETYVATPLDCVKEGEKQKENNPRGPSKPKITTLDSAEDYIDFLSEDDRLCMVKFHASWCKTCQKFGMQYERIAGEVADLVTDEGGVETFVDEGDMRMAEIEYGAHKDLCKSLGIKKVPSVHFYSSGKKVDGFPCGPKKLPMLLEKLSHYRTLSLPELSFEADMNEGAGLGATVLSTLCKEEDKSKAAQCLAELNN